ncbi:MAG: RsmE family RNA methyltransferase [Deltaproteobacteria bacterium]
MKHRRIFVTPDSISPSGVTFAPKAVHYLTRVLRLKPGDEVRVFDGKREHIVRLLCSGRNELHGEISSSRAAETPNLEITLAFGCIRPRPFQDILRHGTELGVSRFVPLLSLRTSRRPEDKKQRWQTIVASAAAQSGRADLPVVDSPVCFPEFIRRDVGDTTKLLLSTSPAAAPLFEALQSLDPRPIQLVVGPEGGLAPSEESSAVRKGYTAVGLGKGMLRAETAAIVLYENRES